MLGNRYNTRATALASVIQTQRTPGGFSPRQRKGPHAHSTLLPKRSTKEVGLLCLTASCKCHETTVAVMGMY